ncbi:ATP-grasp domain-containing protein [Collinsella sp. AF05-8-2]|uniref:ATP-grasp domain-containing protein n=1 Tax=unclassified Collinsella TaxID=2637548 RepID=UPI000E4AE692|nr:MULTISPECIES: ATP-grasp domain-containing protein [unclassified Collinsella]RGW92047.1 ATP-grasp domain-containing protein [Collinsella sp. AF05-8-2]RGW95239.1 ATP-grasp domain-containing protein [Collinsella sp. AF05-9]
MNCAKKSILMLGGSRQQVVAIEKAKALGFRTVLCDYLPDNPGQFSADVWYQESTTDRELMLDIARKENVSGVLAYSSDPASPTAGYVAETLGLPTNPLSAIETMSEKHLFRAFLKQAGLPCPQAVSFTKGSSAGEVAALVEGFRFPIVVKPTDSSGSKGVSVLEDLSALDAAIAHASGFSRNGTLICEEYIRKTFPHVIGGDIFVVNGEVRFWGLMSCLRDEGLGGLVPVGKKTPSGLSARESAAVKDVLQRLVAALGVRFGELNVEVIVGEGGVPYVLELGSRAGGNMIPVQLSDASGRDLVAANVLCAMGEDPGDIAWDSAECKGAYATYVLHSGTDGVFEGVEKSEAIGPHVYREVIYKERGEAVEAFDGANKALGIEFLRFAEEAEMDEILRSITREIRSVVVARGQ